MSKLFLVLIACVLALSACSGNVENTKQTPTNANIANTAANEGSARATPTATPNKTNETEAAKSECYKVKTGDNVVQKSQTFPVNFEPFKGGCFVTSYNPEYDNPPMETQFAIYKSGKKVFDFPDQFNGATFGCWVDAVAFQDVNHDNLTDIIVIGKCSTKGGPYNENTIYINTGKTFLTRPDGNNRLGDFKTTKEVADFAEDNPQIFYK
jgi:hypothetical protein